MSRLLGLGVLCAATFLILIPYAVTLCIALDMSYIPKEKKLRDPIALVILVLAVGADSLILLLGQRILLYRWNPLRTVKGILMLRFSYQEICAFSILLVFCMVCGGIAGFLIRFALPRLLKRTYGHVFFNEKTKNTAVYPFYSAYQ